MDPRAERLTLFVGSTAKPTAQAALADVIVSVVKWMVGKCAILACPAFEGASGGSRRVRTSPRVGNCGVLHERVGFCSRLSSSVNRTDRVRLRASGSALQRHEREHAGRQRAPPTASNPVPQRAHDHAPSVEGIQASQRGAGTQRPTRVASSGAPVGYTQTSVPHLSSEPGVEQGARGSVQMPTDCVSLSPKQLI
jgi:hypothetical protein